MNSAKLYDEDYLDERSGSDIALAVVSVSKKDKEQIDALPKTFQPIKVVTKEVMDKFIEDGKDLLIGGYPNNYIEDKEEKQSKYFLYTHEGKIEGQRIGQKRIYGDDEDEEDEENAQFEDLPDNMIGLSSVDASQGQSGSPIQIDGQVIGVHVGVGKFEIEDLNSGDPDDYYICHLITPKVNEFIQNYIKTHK